MTFLFKFPLLASLLCFFAFSVFSHHCTAKCHKNDRTSLLALKAGITRDEFGMFNSWNSSTDCCRWAGIVCEQKRRVLSVRFSGGSLSGTISPSHSKLPYLTSFYFQNLGNITGPFPKFLLSSPNLEYIEINDNLLSGPIPVDIGDRLPRLLGLTLSGNRFTGPIPTSISKLPKLYILDLARNALTGTIPDELRNLHHLSILELQSNQLSGKIPEIFALSDNRLSNVNLSSNMLTGEIPATIANATFLSNLNLGHNNLTGEIPDFLGYLPRLSWLDLSSNHFTGVVPSSFKNLNTLSELNLARNALVGPFPELNVTELYFFLLDLSYNKFSFGEFPKWIISLPLVSFNLAGCGLKFRLDDINWTRRYVYGSINLSDNQITGSPIKLMDPILALNEFSASGNRLKFNFSDLVIPENLKVLDLSRNQVFGKIPKSISGLEGIDFSYNHLCGEIPPTKKRFPVKSFIGNDCLCGSPLPPCK